MGDPISATIAGIQLAFQGARIAVEIGKWMSGRQSEKDAAAAASRSAQASAAEEQERARQQDIEDRIDEVLLVLSVLGQRLRMLDVVDIRKLPAAEESARGAFSTLRYARFLDSYDKMPETLHYAVVSALFFCADCYPMHIYRGFGAGVLDRWTWMAPYSEDAVADSFDEVLALLKSMPRVDLLTKAPKGIDKVRPDYEKLMDGKNRKKVIKLLDPIQKEVLRNGHPQPKDKSYVIRYANKSFWATWNSSFTCMDLGNDLDLTFKFQSDPGRLLHAFTIGGFLDLEEGELAGVHGDHIDALVTWLDGLAGIPFRTIPSTELDWAPLYAKIKKSTLKLLLDNGYNLKEYGMPGIAGCMRDTRPKPEKQRFPVSEPTSLAAQPLSPMEPSASPPSYCSATDLPMRDRASSSATSPPYSPTTPMSSPPLSPSGDPSKPKIRRRPVPPPPRPSLRKVRTKHEFTGEDASEVSVNIGEILDVLKEDDEGWLEVRRADGMIGAVPGDYVDAI